MNRLNPSQFADWLMERAAAKDGYIMCAVGQDPRALSEWYFSGQYSGAQLSKARYWRDHAARVFDCQGLADCYVTERAGVGKVNVRARDNYADWCGVKGAGAIPAEKRQRGAAVFIHNGSYVSHVGYLVSPVDADNPAGDWLVVEARGVMYGVVTTRLSARGWNRWGLMDKYFDYAAAPDVPSPLPGMRLLKRGCTGEDVRRLQTSLLELGYDLPKYGADGQYGQETESAVRRLQAAAGIEVDGKYGEESHAALMGMLADADTDEEPAATAAGRIRITGGSVYVRAGAGANHRILTVVRKGDELEYTTRANNGWYAVRMADGDGWVSGKYAEVIA